MTFTYNHAFDGGAVWLNIGTLMFVDTGATLMFSHNSANIRVQ